MKRFYLSILIFLIAMAIPVYILGEVPTFETDTIQTYVKTRLIPVRTDTMPIPEFKDKNKTSNNVAKIVDPDNPNPPFVDYRGAVGKIEIESGHSPSGAKTYNIPINMAEEPHGMPIDISLSYNSHRGNGLVGIGWRLEGIPMITRVTKTIFNNGSTGPISGNKNDAFMLDGLRLVKTSENNGEIWYITEQGNIKAKGIITDNDISAFEVYYPDGRKGSFPGYKAEQVTIHYPVYEITDLYDNKISYLYRVDSPEHIAIIQYGQNYIEFEYTNRQDKIIHYIGGTEHKLPTILNKIRCRYGADVLGEYTLSYNYVHDVSELSQVNYTANGESLKPLTFYYGTGVEENNFETSQTQLVYGYNFSNPNNIRASVGRFDYDNDDEGIIIIPNYPSYYEYKSGSKFWYHNYYDDEDTILLYAGLHRGSQSPYPNLTAGEGFVDILCADIFGTQQECIIKINNIVEDDMDCVKFHIYGYESYAGIQRLGEKTFYLTPAYNVGTQYVSVHPKSFYAGDFNGDGKIEILAISDSSTDMGEDGVSVCYIFDLVDGHMLYENHIFDYYVKRFGSVNKDATDAYNNSDRVFVMDFDGDGKTDLCHLRQSALDMYRFDVGVGSLTSTLVYSNSNFKKTDLCNRSIVIGDLNCDGLMDMAITPSSTNTADKLWHFHYSTGNGSTSQVSMSMTPNDVGNYGGFFMRDVNGDGKSDIVKFDANYFTCFYVNPKAGTFTHLQTQMASSNSKLIPMDINSHNLSATLCSLNQGMATKYTTADIGEETLLTKMIESTGITEINEYRKIRYNNEGSEQDEDAFYIMDKYATFPYIIINEPISVLASTTKTHKNTEIARDRFWYKNAVIHRQGLGFCGFETITTQDISGQFSRLTFEPYKFGMLMKSEQPGKTVAYNNSASVANNRTLKLQVDGCVEMDYLTDTTTETNYGYDTYGNLISEISVIDEDLIIDKTFEYASNNINGTGYYVGYKTKEEIIKSSGSNSISESTAVMSYSKCRPLTIENYIDGNLVKHVDLTYNQKGNILSESAKSYSSSNILTTTCEYDDYERLAKKTYPEGLTETYEYDSKNRVSKMKDRRDGITQYSYDAFGRAISINHPDGSVENTTYKWNRDFETGFYDVVKDYSTKPMTITTYDAFGRIVREGDMRFDGRMRYINTEYDVYGNVVRKSLPYTSAEAKHWNTYEYDKYNRLELEDYASGKSVWYNYNGKSITIYTNDIPVTKTFDGQGNLLSVVDSSGTLSNTYDADGQLLTTLAPGTTEHTIISYDNYRRRSSVYDPSLGLTRWTYDESGNIASVAFPNNKTVSYEYDKFGRVLKETSPEMTTTFRYNEYGDVCEKVADNGSEIYMKYDECGRVISRYEGSLDDNWLCKDFTFDRGQLVETAYTFNNRYLRESYEYINGHLEQVYLNGSERIFSLLGENEFGQPTMVETGPIDRYYEYTEFGLPSRRVARKDGEDYQDISYVFENETSNLLYCENGRYSLDFEYDELDRLTSYGGKHMSYDNKGNILGKADVGAFKYTHTLKPYVITEASIHSESIIPSDTQTIQYTSSGRPAAITESGMTASFTYNPEHERTRMRIQTSTLGDVLTKYYMGGCLEIDTKYNKNFEKLYLMGDYYKSPVVWINDDKGSRLVYVVRDYLGSITHVIAENGDLLNEIYYDAWGRTCELDTDIPYNYKDAPYPYLGRGFTGHEHLPMFGLINMNARLCDPVLGRFLSPDPYIQNPESSQNFNRFSYALNNPLKYTDPSGESFLSLFLMNASLMNSVIGVVAFIDLCKNIHRIGPDACSYDWTKTRNSWKLFEGMFSGSAQQVFNKWGWSRFNSQIGYWMAQGYNLFGHRGTVTKFSGAVALSDATDGSAVTVGHYTLGPENYKADYRDNLFVHEYGHYIQSQAMGTPYLVAVGLPSLISAGGSSKLMGVQHRQRWFEVNASKMAGKFFDKHFGPNSGVEVPFEINQFHGSGYSSYQNPRTNLPYHYNDNGPCGYPQGNPFPAHYHGIYFWDFI